MSMLLNLQAVSLMIKERTLINQLDCAIEDEGISIILGHNGAGKTILLQLMAGLISPTSGRIEHPIAHPDNQSAALAMVFQKPTILRRSVLINVRFALEALSLSQEEMTFRCEQVLKRVGLWERRHDPARILSGGERQRLALARAWAVQARLLLLDEPTAHLDPGATQAVERIVREIRSDGCRVVMSTHNIAQSLRLSDEILFLDNGALVERASTQHFFARPQTRAAQMFIKSEFPWRLLDY